MYDPKIWNLFVKCLFEYHSSFFKLSSMKKFINVLLFRHLLDQLDKTQLLRGQDRLQQVVTRNNLTVLINQRVVRFVYFKYILFRFKFGMNFSYICLISISEKFKFFLHCAFGIEKVVSFYI